MCHNKTADDINLVTILETIVDIDEKIAEANLKLRAANTRVSVERRRQKIYLRATLPPKPHLERKRPYQQKISLGLKATPAGLQTAVVKAKTLDVQLQTEKFSWSDWVEAEETGKKTSLWLEEFEKSHWEHIKKTGSTLTTWKGYQSVFNKLDCSSTLTLNSLLEAIKSTEPDSRTRKKVCTYLYKLAEFASVEGLEAIRKLQGNYSTSSVQPRNLPTDKQIAEYRESIKGDAWKWFYGMLACYGLRSHEVFRLNMEDFPVVRVTTGKTGERFIYPLYPEWAITWKLQDVVLPAIDTSFSNAKLGTKVSGWFRDRKVPFHAYDLRHCYARRCFEFGLAPDWASGLMGHSLSVHMTTYRAWIDEATYRKAYELVINRTDRPTAPNVTN